MKPSNKERVSWKQFWRNWVLKFVSYSLVALIFSLNFGGMISKGLAIQNSSQNQKWIGSMPKKAPKTQSEKSVLVAEVVIRQNNKDLEKGIINEVKRVIKTKAGQPTTRSQLQKDINEIFGLGYFSSVNAMPDDTHKGVRITFNVTLNPIFRRVKLKQSVIKQIKIGDKETTVLKVLNGIFLSQYGQIINYKALNIGIKELIKVYRSNGYTIAQIIASPKIDNDGTVTFTVAEGVIDNIKVQFIKNVKGNQDEEVVERTLPINGHITITKILNEFSIKPGDVFKEPDIKNGINHLQNLDLAEGFGVSIETEKKSKNITIVVNVTNEYTPIQKAAKKAFDKYSKDKSSSIKEFEKVLEISRREKSKSDEAETLNNIAVVYKELENYSKASEFYSQALEIFKESHSNLPASIAAINLADVFRQLGELNQALIHYKKALGFIQMIGNRKDWNSLYGNFPSTAYLNEEKISKYLPALKFIYQALLPLEISITYAGLGEYQQSIYTLSDADRGFTREIGQFKIFFRQFVRDGESDEFFEKYSNEITQSITKLTEVLIQLSNNLIYSSLGQVQRAQNYTNSIKTSFQDLVRIWKIAIYKHETDEDDVTPYLKEVLEALDTLSKADDFQQFTLPIQKLSNLLSKTLMQDDDDDDDVDQVYQQYFIIITQTVLTFFVQAINNDQKFISTINQTLLLWEKLDPRFKENTLWSKAFLLKNQGDAYFRLRKYGNSLQSYQESLNLTKSKSSSPKNIFTVFSLINTPEILLAIAKNYDALKQPKNALDAYYRALDAQGKSIPNLQQAEIHYGIAKIEKSKGNIIEAQSQIELSIKESENPPTNITNHSAGSGITNIQVKHGYNLKDKSKLTFGFNLSSKTFGYVSDSQKVNPGNPCSTLSAYFECKQKYLEIFIDTLSKLKHSSNNVKSRSFEAIERSKFLNIQLFDDKKTNFVERVKGLHVNSQFPLSNSQILKQNTDVLPNIQNLIDDQTLILEYFLGEEKSYLWSVSSNSLDMYTLPKRSEIEAKAKRFYDSLTSPMGRIRPKTTAIAGKELSNAILSPVAKKLGQKRLLIVGDGILQYIPFSALPDPVSNSDRRIIGEFASYLQPLLVNHEVINLISPFTMLQSRQRQRTKPTMDLAIVANPVLSRESDLEPIYSPLPQTKREAEQILKYFPSEKRSEFSHFDANHENVVGSNLSRYRLIHFATHSIFNPQSPQKSGVVLSAINQMDEMQVGLVNPDDAFNMNLLGTELVVLSGCRTGLGVQPIREGLTGLTGGFMAAGAKRVLVSLWSVNDDATEKLMTQFYENMMKRSLTPAQALRSAQLAMWQDEQWQTPYNWSAFTLYGDWN